MFDAVELCEKKVEEFLKQNPKSKKGKSIEFPQVHLVVTGDGDMRKYYEEEWKKKNFNFFFDRFTLKTYSFVHHFNNEGITD